MRSFLLRCAPIVAIACLGPLDILGQPTSVMQHQEGQLDPLTDDRLEDKHPRYDPALISTEPMFPYCNVATNRSASVTRLDVVPWADADAAMGTRLFHDFSDALATLPAADVVPSMEVINAELKAFNDGLYAAVELGAQDGSDQSLVDKHALLVDLATDLAGRSVSGTPAEMPLAARAAAHVGAALRLGGGDVPAGIAGVEGLLASFDADPIHARPIGFYTWTPELSAIFRQDRFLQAPDSALVDFGAFASIAVALSGSPGLGSRYGRVLDLYAGLTNAFYDRPVRDLVGFTPSPAALDDLGGLAAQFQSAYPTTKMAPPCNARLAFVPASDSPEIRLYRRMVCGGTTIPGSFIDAVVDAVRSGTLDLTPTATSGFYDRQLSALASLLVTDSAPEKDHLLLTKRYKQKLVDTFKALLIETRETHVKQLSMGTSTVAAVVGPRDFVPSFRVEPFPTFYLRAARAYAFLRPFLTTVMGAAFLQTAHRVEEDGGRGSKSLADELREKTALLYGLSALSARTLGMADLATAEELASFPDAVDVAEAFLNGWKGSPDVARDPRVIVPVAVEDTTVRYWAVVGAKAVQVDASYVQGFEPKVVSTECPFTGKWIARRPVLFSLESVEVRRPRGAPPPTRAEFRALCNTYGTKDAIVKALESP